MASAQSVRLVGFMKEAMTTKELERLRIINGVSPME
jgi:hypothetical protein